jgi:hypothetical protein
MAQAELSVTIGDETEIEGTRLASDLPAVIIDGDFYVAGTAAALRRLAAAARAAADLPVALASATRAARL